MRSGCVTQGRRVEYAWLPQKLGETRRGRRGCIKGSLKGSPLLGAQPEFLAIRQSLFGARECAFKDELTDGAVRDLGGDLEGALRRWRQPQIEFFISGFGVRHDGLPFAFTHDIMSVRHCHDINNLNQNARPCA
jgi:hypothetical protein